MHVCGSPPSLMKLIRDNVHKAFWDILESELSDDPPEYGHAVRLLEEIREVNKYEPATEFILQKLLLKLSKKSFSD